MAKARALCILMLAVAAVTLFRSTDAVHSYDRENDNDKSHGQYHRATGRFSAEPHNFSSDVISLQGDDFLTRLNKYPLALVLFHAPWSHSCQQLYPAYNDIAAELGNHDPKIYVAEIDLMQYPEVGKRYRISGFPTMMVFRKGIEAKDTENQVPRDKATIIQHMKGLVHPAAVEVLSNVDAAKFVDPKTQIPVPQTTTQGAASTKHNNNLVVFGFLPGDFEDAKEAFVDVAQLMHTRFTFVFTTLPEIKKKYGAPSEEPTVTVYKNYDDKAPATFNPTSFTPTKDFTRSEIHEFIINHSLPLVGDFTAETRLAYVARRQPMLIYFSHLLSDKNPNTLAMVNVAKIFRNVTFVFADPWKNDRLYGFLDLDTFRGRHGYAIAMLVGKEKFRYNTAGKFTEENLANFVRGVHEGLVPEFKKSAPPIPPPKLGSGRVHELCYTNFKDAVEHYKRETVVLFYNSQDRVSMQLVATFEKLAKKFAHVKPLVFAQFDGIENDQVPGYECYGFPKIILVHRYHGEGHKSIKETGKYQHETYTGSRNLESIASWLENHLSVDLDPDREWEDHECEL